MHTEIINNAQFRLHGVLDASVSRACSRDTHPMMDDARSICRRSSYFHLHSHNETHNYSRHHSSYVDIVSWCTCTFQCMIRHFQCAPSGAKKKRENALIYRWCWLIRLPNFNLRPMMELWMVIWNMIENVVGIIVCSRSNQLNIHSMDRSWATLENNKTHILEAKNNVDAVADRIAAMAFIW